MKKIQIMFKNQKPGWEWKFVKDATTKIITNIRDNKGLA